LGYGIEMLVCVAIVIYLSTYLHALQDRSLALSSRQQQCSCQLYNKSGVAVASNYLTDSITNQLAALTLALTQAEPCLLN